jgi:hypothetical protein
MDLCECLGIDGRIDAIVHVQVNMA